MSRRPLRSIALVGREAVRNVRSWPAACLVVIAMASTVGGVVASTTYVAAADALQEINELDANGRRTVRVIPTSASGLSDGLCEQLRAIDGVQAAYGTSAAPAGRTFNGIPVSVQLVTPGIEDYLDQPRTTSRRWVYVGAAVAERAGLVDGGWIVMDGWPPTTVAVLDATPRTTALDDSVLVVVAPGTPVNECRVAPKPGAKGRLVSAIPALAAPGHPVTVAPLRPDIENDDGPERRLRSLPGGLVPILGGAMCGLATIGWWFVRRGEWSLYRTFGLSPFWTATLAGIEWLIVAALPLAVGGAWGLAATDPLGGRLAYDLAVSNTLVALLASAVTAAIGIAAIRHRASALVLRTA